MKVRQVYFGHSRNIYGSEKAKEIKERLRFKYDISKWLVFDPEYVIQNSRTMENCFRAIERSDVCVFVPELQAGYEFTLGRGQASELLYAMSLGKKIEIIYP